MTNINNKMLHKKFYSNIAPSTGTGPHLAYKAEISENCTCEWNLVCTIKLNFQGFPTSLLFNIYGDKWGGGSIIKRQKREQKRQDKKTRKGREKTRKKEKNIMQKDKKIKRKEALSPGAFTEHCLAVCCSTLHLLSKRSTRPIS